VNPTAALATTGRVLTQVRHDRRTLGLLLVIPCVLLSLLAWIYDGTPVFDRIGAALLGVFPFVVMFLLTSVTTLRERSSGTLERLLTMPLGRLDFIVGYALAFGLLATVQALIAAGLALGVLGLDVAGPAWLVVLTAVLVAVLGSVLGLFVSAFATTEFQAVQFMPAVVLPQFLLSGLLVPRDSLGTVLGAISDVLPLSYAVDIMRHVTVSAEVGGDVLRNALIIVGFSLLAVVLGAATLRRRTP
jgi:ABC-2 type transport system permease protein